MNRLAGKPRRFYLEGTFRGKAAKPKVGGHPGGEVVGVLQQDLLQGRGSGRLVEE